MSSSTSRDIQHHVNATPRPAAPARRAAGPLTALLIAGDQDQAAPYAFRLRLDGYSVAIAATLASGLDLAGTLKPDLVFVCLGSWAVPALVLLALRSEEATRGRPVVLVSDRTRLQLAAEVGGLLPTENVVPRRSAVHVSGVRTLAPPAQAPGCGSGWSRRPPFDTRP